MIRSFSHNILSRFIEYVKIDTQSDPSSDSVPSTEKQKDLGCYLVAELKEMGITDAEIDEYGYVYATIPSNSPKNVPVICFCSHMDTSPDCSGTNVKPVVHKNYDGKKIILPGDNSQIINPEDHPAILDQIGNDIVTSDGTTLLGADNKAGIAAIMNAAEILVKNREIIHGAIKILFTPDEEIGRGVDHVDMVRLAATFGYTIDGETRGHLEDETFSADGVKIIIYGYSTHPGFAKGKMENALKIAGKILASLPLEISPEKTSGKEGFIHPVKISGSLENAELNFIIRDFDENKLHQFEERLEIIVKEIMRDYPKSSYEFKVNEQYRNMKVILDKFPEVVENAMEAIRRAGMNPVRNSIRGGTDGSRLSFIGLPCPNIFAGEHAFHSKLEWVSVQDMEKASETIIHLASIWEEKSSIH